MPRTACLLLLGVAFLLQGASAAHAQGSRPYVELESGAAATTGSTVPFWMHTNTAGLVDPASESGWLRGRVRGVLAEGTRWDVRYGVEAVTRASATDAAYLPAVFAEARYGFLRLWAGRRTETIGSPAGRLTSGSLGTSRNATPIPMIALATNGYTGVPFTNRWVEFKGRYTHGWLPDDRVVTDAYLHQKTFYLRGGAPGPLRLHAGLIHNAMWGGTTERFGRLPQSLDDYWRTVVALNGSEDAPEGEAAYIQGDHFGAIDVGAAADVGPVTVQAYRQFIYEDRDNLKLKSPQDGLFGLVLRDTRANRWVDALVYEHLYTKWQNGPVPPDGPERGGPGGQDDYYGHYIYQSGWTLYGRTAGSPLMTPHQGERPGIGNNRVVGHHIGVGGHAGPVAYRLLATYTRNYGRYRDEDIAQANDAAYRFNPPLEQVSLLADVRMPWPTDRRFEVQAALGVDTGEMYDDALGVQLGVLYRPWGAETQAGGAKR